jgi:hypothetical protein
MPLISTFNVAIQTIAAFVVFIVGYATLFISLMICFAIAKGLYESAKRAWKYAEKLASARREKSLAIPA